MHVIRHTYTHVHEIVNFSFFALYSLLLLSFFLYLKSVPIYVIVHVHNVCHTVFSLADQYCAVAQCDADREEGVHHSTCRIATAQGRGQH